MRKAILVALLSFCYPVAVRAEDEGVPKEYRVTVSKGLKWMASQQHRDGHWEAASGQYPVTMTSIGGLCLLMEGSTVREGKYKDNIRRAADWLISKAQPNGLIGNPSNINEAGRYMYGHGFGLTFLACVYCEENDSDRRKMLEGVLERAAKFSRDAQTNRGGWGYVSAKEGNQFDEGSVTITQMQGLRAARNAGIAVPPDAIKKAVEYLEASTTPKMSKDEMSRGTPRKGGVIYSLGGGGGGDGRPALTAAAISCGFSAGDYNSPLVKRWFLFCRDTVPTLSGGRFGHDEYTHYYYAQAMYMLGDEGWKKLFPDSKPDDRLTWSKYRKDTFDYLKRSQNSDGSWSGGHVGPIFITAVHLSILQLDKGVVPLYMR